MGMKLDLNLSNKESSSESMATSEVQMIKRL